MTFFKLKRHHSPFERSGSIGISNYKRIKLIEDFEKLSLSDNNTTIRYDRDSYIKDMGNPVTQIVKTKINLPKSIKNRIVRNVLSDPRDRDQIDNDGIVYSRIYDWIREESMKLIPWIDWRKQIYQMWLRWYQNISWNYNFRNQSLIYDNEGDYNNMCNFNENNFSDYSNYISDNTDMDIDMDD